VLIVWTPRIFINVAGALADALTVSVLLSELMVQVRLSSVRKLSQLHVDGGGVQLGNGRKSAGVDGALKARMEKHQAGRVDAEPRCPDQRQADDADEGEDGTFLGLAEAGDHGHQRHWIVLSLWTSNRARS
jgi:hypothetical protein